MHSLSVAMWFILLFFCVTAAGASSPIIIVPKKCGANEHQVKNVTICQKTCGNRLLTYTEEPCAPFTGCVCDKGFVRPYDNATGACIAVGCCPPIPKKCGHNETATSCKQVCGVTCDISYTEYQCLKIECKPGCNCKQNYLRTTSGDCILNDDCPPAPGTIVEPITPEPGDKCCSKCRPTCAVPNPPNCPKKPYDSKDPCQCAPGFVLTEIGGECTQVENCPDNLGCNGKKNAVIKSCPQPCPSTCDSPNTSLKTCKKKCQLGCECQPGYIWSKINGECIRPDKCPCGNPCNRPNEEYTSCKVSCTPVYCPVDDVDIITICDIPSPCDSGCVCKFNYRRLSIHNNTCIPAEDCPPVKCTKLNEEWFGCRPYCPREFCSEVGKYCSPPFVRSCTPRCNCKDGYYRNNKDVCVPECECPRTS